MPYCFLQQIGDAKFAGPLSQIISIQGCSLDLEYSHPVNASARAVQLALNTMVNLRAGVAFRHNSMSTRSASGWVSAAKVCMQRVYVIPAAVESWNHPQSMEYLSARKRRISINQSQAPKKQFPVSLAATNRTAWPRWS